MKIRSLIGTKDFYRRVLAISIPLMIQQGITSFISLLDNIMVGQLDPTAINGVTVANQIMFVVIITFVGGLAGPGIYLSQFFGAKDDENIRQTFRIKILFAIVISIVSLVVLSGFGHYLVSLFLDNPSAIEQGSNYIFIMIFNIIPLAISVLYASSLREIGETKIPMISGLVAVFVNFAFNTILIFGVGDFIPAMGVVGAAIATLIARLSDMFIVVIMTHRRQFVFIKGVYNQFRIKGKLMWQTLIKGVPLLLNEMLWSSGVAVIMYAYSLRGDDVISSLSIANTTSNLLFVMFGALATSFAVLVGNELGANKLEEAKGNAYRLIALGLVVAVASSLIVSLIAPMIPYAYNVDQTIRDLATQFLWIVGVFFPVFTFNASCFFILRAGGSTLLAFIFDSFFSLIVVIPVALYIGLYTDISIFPMYLLIQCLDLVKSILGYFFLRQGKWVRNLSLMHQG